MKSHGKGYQPSRLKKPVSTWTRLAATSRASVSRSTVRPTEGNGGQRNTFGKTDHSLTRINGMLAIPVVTWTPWVTR